MIDINGPSVRQWHDRFFRLITLSSRQWMQDVLLNLSCLMEDILLINKMIRDRKD